MGIEQPAYKRDGTSEIALMIASALEMTFGPYKASRDNNSNGAVSWVRITCPDGSQFEATIKPLMRQNGRLPIS